MSYFSRRSIKYALRKDFSNEQIALAIHEACHCVVALATESRVDTVWIAPPGNGRRSWSGRCEYHHYVDTAQPGQRFARDINDGLIAVAGSVAKEFVDWSIRRDAPAFCLRMSEGDHEILQAVYENSFSDYPSYAALLVRMKDQTERILKQHTGGLTRVVHALLVAGMVDGDTLEALPDGLGLRWRAHVKLEADRETCSKSEQVSKPVRPLARSHAAGVTPFPRLPTVRGLEYSVPTELVRLRETRRA